MSAFMVDKVHVDLLVKVAAEGPSGVEVNPGTAWQGHVSWPRVDWPELAEMGWQESAAQFRSVDRDYDSRDDRISPDELGLILVAENLASIHGRYPDTVGDHGAVPGPLEPYWADYHYQDPRYRLSVPEALSAISCYEYQSCEHAGWRTSEAFRFCDALAGALVARLDGVRAAPWGWTSELVAQRRAVR